MTRATTLTVLLLGVTGTAWAQESREVPLSQRAYDVFEVSEVFPLHGFEFDVAAASRLVLDVTTHGAAVGVSVTDPLGGALDPGAFSRFSIAEGEVPPLGAFLFEAGEHIQVAVDDPAPGRWRVDVTLEPGASPVPGAITAVATGGLGLAGLASRAAYPAGDPAVITLVAFAEAAPVTGGSAQATLYQPGFETSPIATIVLDDDGAGPDAASGDGLYTGAIAGLAPGPYLAKLRLEADGIEAFAGAGFEVVAPLARFTGTWRDAGVDADLDGRFDAVRIELDVSVEAPGEYEVLAELATASGAEPLVAGARATLAAGAGSVPLSFAAADLRRHLAEDGPWRLGPARLVRVSPDGASSDVLADFRADLGLTGAYSLTQLERPTTLILPGLVESGIDTDGNALYDLLGVSFDVDTLQLGSYTWTADLRAPDGTVLGVASNQGFLSPGASRVSFAFSGEAIGASGLNGPYSVGNVAVYGPAGAAAVAAELGDTRAYAYTQFEGGTVSFESLVAAVRDLVVTGPGGVPRARGIRQSLLRKVENAQAQARRGNARAAGQLLEAFLHELAAQAGRHVAPADAERLTALATGLREGP